MLPGQFPRLGRVCVTPRRGLVGVVMMMIVPVRVIVRMVVRVVFVRSSAQQF